MPQNMPLNDALNWRYAVNKFDHNTLSPEQINHLIESVRLAPSAYGIQPYKLLVISNPKTKRACLPYSYGQDKVAKCSHLLVLAHKTKVTQQDIAGFIEQLAKTQNKTTHLLSNYQIQIQADLLSRSSAEQNNWAQQQTYIALGILLASAAASFVDACPMTGFEVDGINKVLELNQKDLSAAVLCPVGIRAENDFAAHRTKHRISQDQLVVNL
ncbi:MAG: nitroreductase family protein [Paraglaciecola sp.]|uniref:nitroreductase family protein n=1 Tax=Paraglaciecola sp. TaxID=1920173 RepID=UPI003296AB05